MIVFSQDEFQRVNVDAVFVCTARCFLHVMVLVNIPIDCFDMKEPMHRSVKEVKNNEKDGNW